MHRPTMHKNLVIVTYVGSIAEVKVKTHPEDIEAWEGLLATVTDEGLKRA